MMGPGFGAAIAARVVGVLAVLIAIVATIALGIGFALGKLF